MGNENKHGRYEEFDRGKATWACPKCKKDSLKLGAFLDNNKAPTKVLYIFQCGACDFNSKDYAIVMGPKSTYNSVHRWLMREWDWINHLTKKWAAIGANAMDAMYKKEFDDAPCPGECSSCEGKYCE